MTIRRGISDAVERETEYIKSFSLDSQKADGLLKDKKENLLQLEIYTLSLREEIDYLKKTHSIVVERMNEAGKFLNRIKSEISSAESEKNFIEQDIISLKELKKEISCAISAHEKKLSDMAEKEQFLNRKEADLIKYEKRVEKMREDAGNKNKMKFK